MLFKYILALPTWAITRIVVYIIPKHLWKTRKFTLEDWYKGRTPLTVEFDVVFWFAINIILLFLIDYLF